MKRRLAMVVAALVLIVGLLYLGDLAWLRIRMARNPNSATDSVRVDIMYQIPQKGNKAEYVPQESQMQSCVRSIFPHMGDQPCWYLRRHTEQQVNF